MKERKHCSTCSFDYAQLTLQRHGQSIFGDATENGEFGDIAHLAVRIMNHAMLNSQEIAHCMQCALCTQCDGRVLLFGESLFAQLGCYAQSQKKHILHQQ